MFREALSAPTRTDDAVTTLFMGGFLVLVATVVPLAWLFAVASPLVFLLLVPLVVFPPLVLRGYYVRTVRVGLRDGDATPSFVRWGALVRDGAKSALLSAGYLLPFVVLVGGSVGLAALLASNVVAPNSPVGVVAALGVVLCGFGTLGYGAAYLYVRPAALAVFAASGRLRDGFALRRVFGVARRRRYAGGWLRAVTVLTVGLVVAAPTTLAVVGVFVAFYARVLAHLLYGRGAASALDVTDDDEDNRVVAVALDDRPSEVSPAVQTGRTVGPAGCSERGHLTSATVEVDGGDGDGSPPAETETGVDHETDPFVWGDDRRHEPCVRE
ncbi:Protein of unknown function [Halogranum amylolyticum]|uniref:DUF4013 domain-containing protein n=1 Tax=Halogranum amylolyticum TaxID=660520 RepID=A0A1H8S3T2_9EURY|nr:DUF4013 domain-containing protein [Halogranum amylolyticum]SEO73351.1 Protein of unknown function [Halogranum amylolyticum]